MAVTMSKKEATKKMVTPRKITANGKSEKNGKWKVQRNFWRTIKEKL